MLTFLQPTWPTLNWLLFEVTLIVELPIIIEPLELITLKYAFGYPKISADVILVFTVELPTETSVAETITFAPTATDVEFNVVIPITRSIGERLAVDVLFEI